MPPKGRKNPHEQMIAYIQNWQQDKIDEFLQKIPYQNLDHQVFFGTLIIYLRAGYEIKNDEALISIMTNFNEYHYSEYSMELMSFLYTLPQLEDDLLKYVNNLVYPNIGKMEHMKALLAYDSSPEMIMTFKRIERLFNLSVEDHHELSIAVDKQEAQEGIVNDNFRELVREEQRISNPFVAKPDWVKDFGIRIKSDNRPQDPADEPTKEIINKTTIAIGTYIDETKQSALPFHEELEKVLNYIPNYFQTPKPERAVDILTGNLDHTRQRSRTPEEEDSFLKILQLFIQGNESEKRQLLEPYFKTQNLLSLQGEEILFRIFGPSHPIYNYSYKGSDDICAIHGGCRMFTCLHFEHFDQDYGEIIEGVNDTQKVDWFHGFCLNCNNRIKKRHYALRRPIWSGGWIGCYCSWKCIREDTPDINYSGEPDPISPHLYTIIEAGINRIGIQDRDYYPVPDKKTKDKLRDEEEIAQILEAQRDEERTQDYKSFFSRYPFG